jgi:hypothetical protein
MRNLPGTFHAFRFKPYYSELRTDKNGQRCRYMRVIKIHERVPLSRKDCKSSRGNARTAGKTPSHTLASCATITVWSMATIIKDIHFHRYGLSVIWCIAPVTRTHDSLVNCVVQMTRILQIAVAHGIVT